MNVRKAQQSDIPELKELYMGTVLTVNRKDYSQEEVEDWASCGEDEAHLGELIAGLYFVVAENEQKQITGFASITDEGYSSSGKDISWNVNKEEKPTDCV